MNELGGAAYITEMYEGRSDLGNYAPFDGAKFSDCGAIQCLTVQAGRHLDLDTLGPADFSEFERCLSKKRL